MSEENVEIVRRMFEAFRKRDWAGALEPVDSDEIEMDVSRSPIEGLSGVYRGREELAFFWGQWLEAWGGQEIEEPELIDAGDKVILWVTRHKFRGRGSGVEVDFPPYAWLVTLRNGKIIDGTIYMDRDEALEAAGLSESCFGREAAVLLLHGKQRSSRDTTGRCRDETSSERRTHE